MVDLHAPTPVHLVVMLLMLMMACMLLAHPVVLAVLVALEVARWEVSGAPGPSAVNLGAVAVELRLKAQMTAVRPTGQVA